MASFPPFPHFNLNDPCAADPDNLVTNGSMGPSHHHTDLGSVVDGWEPFVISGEATFRWVDNEGIDPGGSQQIFSSEAFDAGVFQRVRQLETGMVYMFRLGYSLAAKSVDGPNVRVNTIGRRIGVDPNGGGDPLAADVIWGPELWDGKAALNRPEMQMVFVAQAKRATIFLRGIATESGNGENRVWFDAICMEARPDILASGVGPPAPQPQPQPQPTPEEPATLEQVILARTDKARPWMPVNNGAALWNFAKAQGLEDQQTDELEFTWKGDKYLCQVFNLGIVYVKAGDWGNIKVIRK